MTQKFRARLEQWLDKQNESNLVIIAEGILNRSRKQIENEVGGMSRNQWESLVLDLLKERGRQ